MTLLLLDFDGTIIKGCLNTSLAENLDTQMDKIVFNEKNELENILGQFLSKELHHRFKKTTESKLVIATNNIYLRGIDRILRQNFRDDIKYEIVGLRAKYGRDDLNTTELEDRNSSSGSSSSSSSNINKERNNESHENKNGSERKEEYSSDSDENNSESDDERRNKSDRKKLKKKMCPKPFDVTREGNRFYINDQYDLVKTMDKTFHTILAIRRYIHDFDKFPKKVVLVDNNKWNLHTFLRFKDILGVFRTRRGNSSVIIRRQQRELNEILRSISKQLKEFECDCNLWEVKQIRHALGNTLS